jgi:hypothetical protein
MKKRTLCLTLVLSSTACAQFAPLRGIDHLDIIGAAGQSNMVGYAPPNSSFPRDPGILRWSGTDQLWLTASEEMNIGGPGYVGSKSLLFTAGHELLTCVNRRGMPLYDPVGFVSCAVDGSCLSSWMPGKPNYEIFIDQMRKALAAAPRGSRFAGIFWLQGECEAAVGGASIEVYYTRAWEMFLCMREDLGDQTIPIVIGEIGNFRLGSEPMNDVLRSLAATLPYCSYAESIGLTSHDHNHHFDSYSLDQIGRRFAQSFRRVDAIRDPLLFEWRNRR